MDSGHRKERLRLWLRSNTAEHFKLKTGHGKSYLSQLLDPDKPFGERAARTIETRLALPAGWLDAVPSKAAKPAVLSEEQLELLALWEPLLEDQRAEIMLALRGAHTYALKIAEEMARRNLVKTFPASEMSPNWQRPPQGELPIGVASKKARK